MWRRRRRMRTPTSARAAGPGQTLALRRMQAESVCCGSIGAERLRQWRRFWRVVPEILRHGFTLVAFERIRHAHHHAEVQHAEDSRRGYLLERALRRNTLARQVVASCATLAI